MKTGDIIVCINNSNRNPYYGFIDCRSLPIEVDLEYLTLGKSYKVVNSSLIYLYNMVLICNDNGLVRHYTYSGRFIPLKEFRKEKILKLQKLNESR